MIYCVTTSSGLLVPHWPVPDRIELNADGAALEWQRVNSSSRHTAPRPKTAAGKKAPAKREGLLRDFVALDGEVNRTLRFAQRWGLLGLCAHRLPASHRSPHRLSQVHLAIAEVDATADLNDRSVPSRVLRADEQDWSQALPDMWPCEPHGVEALEDWWFWSRHAAAVTSATTKLRIGSALDGAHLAKVADLLPAIRPEQHFPPPPSASAEHASPSEVLAAQRHHLARIAQQWLDLADVTVALEWPKASTGSVGASQPTLTYRGSGLFAAIAIEIALAATTTKAIYICDKCGMAYTRQRAPHKGKKGYCADCKGSGAQATWRANNPEAREKENAAARERRAKRKA